MFRLLNTVLVLTEWGCIMSVCLVPGFSSLGIICLCKVYIANERMSAKLIKYFLLHNLVMYPLTKVICKTSLGALYMNIE